MKHKVIVVALALSATPFGYRAVEACGDKLLLVGRGVRFQRAYAALHPANILIYAKPTTNSDKAIRDAQFHKSLRRAGHHVSVIEDSTLFDHALRLTSIDIILADLAEAPVIDAQIAAASSHPKVLYVEYPNAGNRVLATQFACELKAGDRATRFLDKIDAEMKARSPRASAAK